MFSFFFGLFLYYMILVTLSIMKFQNPLLLYLVYMTTNAILFGKDFGNAAGTIHIHCPRHP